MSLSWDCLCPRLQRDSSKALIKLPLCISKTCNRQALKHQEATSKNQDLLIPEEVRIGVAAELATRSSYGLGGGCCILCQIWGNDIARLLQVCQSICASILHELHAETKLVSFRMPVGVSIDASCKHVRASHIDERLQGSRGEAHPPLASLCLPAQAYGSDLVVILTPQAERPAESARTAPLLFS